MQLEKFLLEEWLARYQGFTGHTLSGSMGPTWTLAEIRRLMSDAERSAFDSAALTYCPGAGRESLREAIASMYGARADEIQVFTGAAEALLAAFFLAAEPGANVLVPHPSFPPFSTLPAAFGLEVRRYTLRPERGFALDPDEIADLTDDRTRLILVNSPHNPTGAVASQEGIRALEAVSAERGVQLIVDEVYHPIYHGESFPSAGEYSSATVLGDFSKAFSLPGVRVGWLLERDPARREKLATARGCFTISSSMPAERLAETAVRCRETIWARARAASARNLAVLEHWMATQARALAWVRPQGGMTAFPQLRTSLDARKFCEAAAARGVLLVPGDCFGYPQHVRIGFGLENDRYAEALEIVAETLAGFEA